jgi:hypothetical protein
LRERVKAPRRVRPRLAALLGFGALLAAVPAASQAAESNPNNYSCLGSIGAGAPQPGSEDHQVKYSFYCDGPITGYQVQTQIPETGISSPPTVTTGAGAPLADTFACSGEIPGYAVNCVGAAKAGYETVSGQFAIATRLCAEPRVDPLLTVTYAYLEKGVVTQAISGPFDLGRPKGCPADAESGGNRLSPKSPAVKHRVKHRRAIRGHRARRHR